MNQGRLSIESICPFCGKILDGYTVLDNDGGGPSDGDFTLCVYCLTPLRFTFGLRLRIMRDDEIRELGPKQRKQFTRMATLLKDLPSFKGGKETH